MGNKRIVKRINIESGLISYIHHIVSLLKDKDFVISSLPCVVARHRERVRIKFSRMLLFRVEDEYTITYSDINDRIIIKLNGKKSTINLEFKIKDNTIEHIGEYIGPRHWIVGACLEEMGDSLLKSALEEIKITMMRKATVSKDHNYSELLARISWISKMLVRFVLIKSEIVAINKGSLISYIENMVSEGILARYKTVYVSGTSDKGSFRLLFVNGELVGTYALIGDKEYIGDDRVLNEFEGFTRIRVYGSNAEPPR